ncbi:MAG: phospholipid carrier-dependent glycosyltransferase [Planctomycetota bacterium]|nr:phospholipid carrier-dependent glycosyltransferase [Planctomycetota bacterium]
MPPAPPASAQAVPQKIRLLLLAGVLLVYLSVWKGEGGYADLREYMDNAERMWLRGDLSDPLTPPGEPKQYNRFSLGLPFLSGPFVYLGAAVEKLSGGAAGTRGLAALAVPVYGALACVLLYGIGLHAGFSARASVWAALLFGLGGPIVSYTRLYYAEVALSFCLFLGLWAHLRARQAPATANACAWALLAGAGLAGVAACHYPNALLAGILGLAFAGAWFQDGARAWGTRLKILACLPAVPALAGLALLCLNYSHYGHPLRTGYHAPHENFAGQVFSPANMPANLAWFGIWLARVPWAPLALGVWICGRRGEPHAGLNARALRAGVAAAFAAQLGFWLSFHSFPMFGLRYQMPLRALAAPGLLVLAAWLERAWPARGLALSGAALFMWNLLGVLRGDDSSQIVFTDPLGRVCCYVWYMAPAEPGRTEGFGTPASLAQLAVFLALALPGVALLVAAARRARAAGPPAAQ